MPIGFLDSGVGGLSVLREAIKIMPNENFIYFGDSKNAPYGVKDVQEVKELTYKGVDFLISKGAKAIVIACNTATSAAVAALRVTYPDMPIVGIEPAVKPAVELGRKGPIIIMATPMTIHEKKFNNLVQKYKGGAEIVPMPCAGLMEFIEAGKMNTEEVHEYLEDKFEPYKSKEIGAVVLGCTHYPFIRNKVREIVGNDVPIIDGGLGTSKEIKRRIEAKGLLTNSSEKGEVKIYNSLNDDKVIELSKRLLFSE